MGWSDFWSDINVLKLQGTYDVFLDLVNAVNERLRAIGETEIDTNIKLRTIKGLATEIDNALFSALLDATGFNKPFYVNHTIDSGDFTNISYKSHIWTIDSLLEKIGDTELYGILVPTHLYCWQRYRILNLYRWSFWGTEDWYNSSKTKAIGKLFERVEYDTDVYRQVRTKSASIRCVSWSAVQALLDYEAWSSWQDWTRNLSIYQDINPNGSVFHCNDGDTGIISGSSGAWYSNQNLIATQVRSKFSKKEEYDFDFSADVYVNTGFGGDTSYYYYIPHLCADLPNKLVKCGEISLSDTEKEITFYQDDFYSGENIIEPTPPTYAIQAQNLASLGYNEFAGSKYYYGAMFCIKPQFSYNDWIE